MKILRSLEHDTDLAAVGNAVVTIGNFDGVHRGHAALLVRARELAGELGIPSVVVTFDPHPAAVLRPASSVQPITWTERKLAIFEESGMEAAVVLPTNRQLLELSGEEFFQRVLIERLRVRAVVEGEDFRFGRGRAADLAALRRMAEPLGVRVESVPPVIVNGQPVSSSLIRKQIEQGNVDAAAELLGRPFRTRGQVSRGAARGRTLGFPTANLEQVPTLLPGEGIYAGAAIVDGRSYAAAISVGGNPTFDEYAVKFEMYILDFDRDLYDELVDVEFLRRLRAVERYDSVDDLRAQMRSDVANAACIFEDYIGQGTKRVSQDVTWDSRS